MIYYLIPKYFRVLFLFMKPGIGFLYQSAFSQSDATSSTSNTQNISVPAPNVTGAAIAQGLALIAMNELNNIRLSKFNDQIVQDAVDARQFLKDCYNQFRDESMGGQEALVRTRYSGQYIPALEARGTYAQLIARAETLNANLQPAITDTDTLLKDLFDKDLLVERLGNIAALRAEEIGDKAIESTELLRAVTSVNAGHTSFALAKVSGINLAFKEEVSRINAEEGRRGYFGGDCIRDMNLLIARLKQQDNIAELLEGTNRDNTIREEEVRIVIAKDTFNLGQNNRGGRFAIGEDDVTNRLKGIMVVGEKAAQNIGVVEELPVTLANNAWNRRFDRRPFAQESGPVGSTVTANRIGPGDSTGAIAAGVIGNLTATALRGGQFTPLGTR